MAVLANAGSDKVDFGTPTVFNGLTSITVAIIFRSADAGANNEDLLGNFGGGTSGFRVAQVFGGWLWQVANAGVYRSHFTTGSTIGTGTLHRLVFRWQATETLAIFENSTSPVADNGFNGGTPASLGTGGSLVIGNTAGIGAHDGESAEFAVWGTLLPDSICGAISGGGYSPGIFRQNGLFYCPLWNTANLRDLWGGLTGTPTSMGDAPHPYVISPRPPRVLYAPAIDAPAGGFAHSWGSVI